MKINSTCSLCTLLMWLPENVQVCLWLMLYFCSTAIPPIPNPLSTSSALTLYRHLFPGDLKEPCVKIGTIFVSQVGQERLEEAALL